MEQGRESGRLGRAVARGEAASPADLVVRLPEACEGVAASPADLGLRLNASEATAWSDVCSPCSALECAKIVEAGGFGALGFA